MATLEERVSLLEGKMDDHTRGLAEVRDAVAHMGQRMDRLFEAVDRRFEAIERRFDLIERRFDAIDRRFTGVEEKIGRLVVVQLAGLTAVLAAMAGMLTAVVFK